MLPFRRSQLVRLPGYGHRRLLAVVRAIEMAE
jgi:hypothetical protein